MNVRLCIRIWTGSNPFLFLVCSKKQGAYGKVQVHKEPRLLQMLRLDEVFSAITLLYIKPLQSNLQNARILQRFNAQDLAFCTDILVKVSRSFAAVIMQLPAALLVDILVFYLVLRALDTIEDDTTAFLPAVKVQHLLNFHKTALVDPNWTMHGVGQGDERRLLEEFPKCHRIYAQLEPPSRRIISDITQRMATGMAEFVDKDLGQGTVDIDQYNRYCHFVAGLVGEGLSRLFAASGLEPTSFSRELHLSDQMGLFLQKTNIIRDYLEDYVDGRAFWPQTVWKKYGDELGYFVNQDDPTVRTKSLECLNELVTDALELVPDCLLYMDKLQCQEIFRFCAIPQVMAIATLAKCYANQKVFTGVVKIRKGQSCKLLLSTNNLAQVHETFYNYAGMISNKAQEERRKGVLDPSYTRTLRACETIRELTKDQTLKLQRARLAQRFTTAAIMALHVAVGSAMFGSKHEGLVLAVAIAAAGLAYFYGPWSVSTDLKTADVLENMAAVKVKDE